MENKHRRLLVHGLPAETPALFPREAKTISILWGYIRGAHNQGRPTDLTLPQKAAKLSAVSPRWFIAFTFAPASLTRYSATLINQPTVRMDAAGPAEW